MVSGNINNIYFDLERASYDEERTVAERLASELRDKYPYLSIKNAYPILSELRMIKSKDEIDEIRKAIAITEKGILNAMKNAKAGMREYEVEAYFDFVLKTNGVKDFAFKTIAASGKNATVLHYSDNDDLIGENEMILMDLGAKSKLL